MLHIGIVAGESSGDLLAAGLMAALREHYPTVRFSGIGGPLMAAQGCECLYPAEALSLIGLMEILGHLPRLFKIRHHLYRHFQQQRPAIFIGVDLPDFNLSLEAQLKQRLKIPIVHYVSPTVWAWRASRMKQIVGTVDLMLTLFPFEAAFYQQQAVAVRFVGHPLAETLSTVPERAALRQTWGIADTKTVIALLPGSRLSELAALADTFIQTALWCCQQQPDQDWEFIAPLATAAQQCWFEQRLRQYPPLPIRTGTGQATAVMQAADAVLVASGTATLEALLLKRPMVVAYRLSPLTFQIAKRLVKAPFIALPNLLAQAPLVPEYIQEAAQPEQLGAALLAQLQATPAQKSAYQKQCAQLSQSLSQNANQQAAQAIAAILALT